MSFLLAALECGAPVAPPVTLDFGCEVGAVAAEGVAVGAGVAAGGVLDLRRSVFSFSAAASAFLRSSSFFFSSSLRAVSSSSSESSSPWCFRSCLVWGKE